MTAIAWATPTPVLAVLAATAAAINAIYTWHAARAHRWPHLVQAIIFETISLWALVGLALFAAGKLPRAPHSPFDHYIDPVRPLMYLSWSLPAAAYIADHRARTIATHILDEAGEELARHNGPHPT